MLGLGSRGHAVDPSTEHSPPTPNTVMKAISDHELQQTEEFRRRIDKHMGLSSRTPAVVGLLPDPQFKKAQESKGAESKKRRYGGSEGRARKECVKRIAMGGKVMEMDARVVGVPKPLLYKQAEQVSGMGPVEDTERSKALSRAASRAAEVGHAGVYTEDEYDRCVLDALKKDRGTQEELCQKYGPSPASMRRGMTHVRNYVQKINNITSNEQCDRLIQDLPDHDLLTILSTLRGNGTIQKMGGKCLLTDQEITAIMATYGVIGHCSLGGNSGTNRAAIARAINNYGRKMMESTESSEQKGLQVEPKEKNQAMRYMNAKLNTKTWDVWRRKYNEMGAVGEGTEVRKGRKP